MWRVVYKWQTAYSVFFFPPADALKMICGSLAVRVHNLSCKCMTAITWINFLFLLLLLQLSPRDNISPQLPKWGNPQRFYKWIILSIYCWVFKRNTAYDQQMNRATAWLPNPLGPLPALISILFTSEIRNVKLNMTFISALLRLERPNSLC